MPGLNHTGIEPLYLAGLIPTGNSIQTTDGLTIDIWRLEPSRDQVTLSGWGKHFREVYSDPSITESLMEGTQYSSRSEFYAALVFPDRTELGPATRSGDFGEILVSDYLQYRLGYWVLKEKYSSKERKNQSMMGIDVVGLRADHWESPSQTDSLFTFEVKAKLTGTIDDARLEVALRDSAKDHLKLAGTLHAEKIRLLKAHRIDEAKRISRFQSPIDNPYLHQSGAAAVVLDQMLDVAALESLDASAHWNRQSLKLMVITGADLMNLVHSVFETAVNEA